MMKLEPINQVIVFKPTRMPMARLVDVQDVERPCPACEGAKVLPVISAKGYIIKEVDCPHCGGVGHA
jgi:hypothetical protein